MSTMLGVTDRKTASDRNKVIITVMCVVMI